MPTTSYSPQSEPAPPTASTSWSHLATDVFSFPVMGTDGCGDIFIYNGIFDDYVRAVGIRQPLEVFDKYRIDYVLLARRVPRAYLLEHSPGCGDYSDNVAVLFQRAAIVGEGARVSTS